LRIHLALESEFGDAQSEPSSRVAVLHDAPKFAFIRATTKVMVVGTRDGKSLKTFRQDLDGLRKNAGDTAPWLLIDLPWFPDADNTWRPDFDILPAGRTKTGR